MSAFLVSFDPFFAGSEVDLAQMVERLKLSSPGGLWLGITKRINAGRTTGIGVIDGSAGTWAVYAILMLKWTAIVNHAHTLNGNPVSMGWPTFGSSTIMSASILHPS